MKHISHIIIAFLGFFYSISLLAQNNTSVYVSPHPDDWQLFMNPNAYHSVKNTNEKVIFLHITSGDAGSGTGNNDYYLAREEGSLRAIRFMSNTYTTGAGLGINMNETIVTINGHEILKYTYRNVEAYFLRLPNDVPSLEMFYNGALSDISAIDNSTTYNSLPDLENTIKSIIELEASNLENVVFNLADDDDSINPDSHSDHMYSSKILKNIANTMGNIAINLYVDYDSGSKQQNVFNDDYLVSAATWGVTTSGLSDNFHYSTWDNWHNKWIGKQYFRTLGNSTIAFTNTAVIVDENITAGFARFNVTLTGDISENVTVDYTTTEGTAINPGDYLAMTGTITFTPTNKSFNIDVPITDDAIIEPQEAFSVVLSNIVSNLQVEFVNGDPTSTANGIINDNDDNSINIAGIVLIDADNNVSLGSITDGMIFNFNDLPTNNLSIEVFLTSNSNSVEMVLSGEKSHTQGESVAPYALFGDSGTGNYNGSIFTEGSYQLTATPYSQGGLRGTQGTSKTVSFQIVSGPVDNDGDGFTTDLDCDDNDASVNPDAPEICDGIDNDCDGIIDEDFTTTTYYADTDGDGFGDPSNTVDLCSAPTGYVSDNTDCDDNNTSSYPGAVEICDGIDNDCDGIIDEDFTTSTYYADTDGDGFGDPSNAVELCSETTGYVSDNTDCDDNNTSSYPGAVEICDGIDNNCDGLIDDQETGIDCPTTLSVTSIVLIDADNNESIGLITDGMIFNLNDLPTNNLSIEVFLTSDSNSVEMVLSGEKSHTQGESVVPYALYGDSGASNYNGSIFTVGSYQLTATPYSLGGLGGTKGTSKTVSFEIVNSLAKIKIKNNKVLSKTEEVFDKAEIKMHPNPINKGDNINIELDNAMDGIILLEAFDIKGTSILRKIIQNNSENKNSINLNTSTFTRGWNIVSLTLGGETISKKVFIK